MLVQFLRFMILINQLIPISLYVTLELVKVMQCTLLTWDLHMFHKASGTPFLCRTTTLNEELGQVQYVLSDKTGQPVSSSAKLLVVLTCAEAPALSAGCMSGIAQLVGASAAQWHQGLELRCKCSG